MGKDCKYDLSCHFASPAHPAPEVGRRLFLRAVDFHNDCEHSMQCFTRVVRAMLGSSAVADEKCQWGSTLTIIGAEVACSVEGFSARPSHDKVKKWMHAIRHSLYNDHLPPGQADKLAGQLSWASQVLFHRMGRAMLRPLYNRQYGKGNCLSTSLRVVLKWWLRVLEHEIVETRPWRAQQPKTAFLFADASATHVGAVLFSGADILYTDWKPTDSFFAMLEDRSDNQIMGLEIVAVAVALCTFRPYLSNMHIRIFSDNTGAESALSKGRAKSFDHCRLTHSIWSILLELKASVYVERVSTTANYLGFTIETAVWVVKKYRSETRVSCLG